MLRKTKDQRSEKDTKAAHQISCVQPSVPATTRSNGFSTDPAVPGTLTFSLLFLGSGDVFSITLLSYYFQANVSASKALKKSCLKISVDGIFKSKDYVLCKKKT